MNADPQWQPIVLIAGATGVGTSTLARHLAPIVRAHGIIGTDAIRETLRELGERRKLSPDYPPVLNGSTYTAWRTDATDEQHAYQNTARITRIRRLLLRTNEPLPPDDHHTDDLIKRAARAQSIAVMDATFGAMRRALREDFALVIEGVHLDLPRTTQATEWRLSTKEDWPAYEHRIFRILLDCTNEYTHLQRLLQREAKHRNRATKARYVQNWHAIQILRNDTRSQAPAAHVIADTRSPFEYLLDHVAKAYYTWKANNGVSEQTIIPAPLDLELRDALRELDLDETLLSSTDTPDP